MRRTNGPYNGHTRRTCHMPTWAATFTSYTCPSCAAGAGLKPCRLSPLIAACFHSARHDTVVQSDRPAVSLDYRQTALIDRYAEPLFYADLVASSILNCNQLNVVCEAYAYTISPPGSSVWSERGGGLVKHSIRFTCCRCSLGLTCDFRSHHLFVDLYYSAVWLQYRIVYAGATYGLYCYHIALSFIDFRRRFWLLLFGSFRYDSDISKCQRLYALAAEACFVLKRRRRNL